MSTVQINGENREVPSDITVSQLLVNFSLTAKMVVVELNGAIVRRTAYDTELVTDGSTVEIVQMMAGG